MSQRLYAVLLAGGKGTRFWPLSTPSKPKQLLKLTHPSKTLLEISIERILAAIPQAQVYVVITQELQEQVQSLLSSNSEIRFLIEPEGKNTAASIAFATASIQEKDPDAVIGVFPADHLVKNEQAWEDAVQAAYGQANKDGIVTIGLKPDIPNTELGYLEIENELSLSDQKILEKNMSTSPVRVVQFKEKPNLEIARHFFKSGKHFFNSGMFFFKASLMWQCFEKYLPLLFEFFNEWIQKPQGIKKDDFFREHFIQLPSISIDYGIMEHASAIFMIAADFGWSDLGTWQSVWSAQKKDAHGNCIDANAKVIQSEQCLVYSSCNLSIAILGVDNLIVVHTEEGILVANRFHTQNVREIADFFSDSNSKNDETKL